MSLGVHRAWKRRLRRRPGSAAGAARCSTSPAAPATSPSAGWRAGGGPAILADVNPAMLAVGRDARASGAGCVARSRLAGRRCRAAAAAGSRGRRGLDRLRPAQLHRQAGGAGRGAARAAPRRAVLRAWNSAASQVAALAPLYDAWSFRVLPRLGAAGCGRRGELSLPRREHPHLSRPGDPRGDDASGRVRARARCATSPAASPRSIAGGGCEPRRQARAADRRRRHRRLQGAGTGPPAAARRAAP